MLYFCENASTKSGKDTYTDSIYKAVGKVEK
jgi:hypothetical protein